MGAAVKPNGNAKMPTDRRVMRAVGISTFVFLLLAGCAPARRTEMPVERPTTTVSFGEMNVTAELAQTPAEQSRGLSGRTGLGEFEGMLFVFSQPSKPAFWMQGMLFSIDIIWLKDGTVVGISKNLPLPSGSPLPTFTPPQPVTAVLEVPAGFAQRHGVRVGDSVQIQKVEI